MKWVTSFAVAIAFAITANGISYAGDCNCDPCATSADNMPLRHQQAAAKRETVMRSQYVTEVREVPVTTYKKEERTRTRDVCKRVARVETREKTYTVNVPETRTRTEKVQRQSVCSVHRGTGIHRHGSGDYGT